MGERFSEAAKTGLAVGASTALAFFTGGLSAAIQVAALSGAYVVQGYYHRRNLAARQGSQRGVRIRSIATQASLPVVYGRARVKGNMADVRVDPDSPDDKVMLMVPAFAVGSENGGGIEAIEQVFLDEELAIDLGSTGRVASDLPSSDPPVSYTNDYDYATRIRRPWLADKVGTVAFGPSPEQLEDASIRPLWLRYGIHTGTDAQEADTGLQARYPNDGNIINPVAWWTAAHRGVGIAYMPIELYYHPEIYRGIPAVSAIIKGQKVYDPRNPDPVPANRWAWSNNPALCILDYLTSKRYGAQARYPERDDGVLETSEIDEASFIAAANYCDMMVTTYMGGAMQKRFECNGWIDTGRTIAQNMAELLTSCR